MKKMLNIVIPMAGSGSRFQNAGYTFPKPVIDIQGKTMIEIVINNLRPKVDHKFIFIVQKEHFDKYDLWNILKNSTNGNFEIVKIDRVTEGAACTALTASQYINNDNDLIIANADQFIQVDFNKFIENARTGEKDGLIMTFEANHPKWSYARVDKKGYVIEVAEKKVISKNATVGIYYFKRGSDFVASAQSMIRKKIKNNNEYYICPVYNELILKNQKIYIQEIPATKMHGLGTPEDLNAFLSKLEKGRVKI